MNCFMICRSEKGVNEVDVTIIKRVKGEKRNQNISYTLFNIAHFITNNKLYLTTIISLRTYKDVF